MIAMRLQSCFGLFQIVRRQEDREPVGVERAQPVPELEAQLDVDAGRRLVENQQLRLVDQRARQRQPALLPPEIFVYSRCACDVRPKRSSSMSARSATAVPAQADSSRPRRSARRAARGSGRSCTLAARARSAARASRHCARYRSRRSGSRRSSCAPSPTIALIVVVLPAPFGPRKPKNSPASTRSEMPSTAVKSPYRLTRRSTSMAGGANLRNRVL